MKEGATTIWSLIMIIDYPHYFANWLWKDKLHIPTAQHPHKYQSGTRSGPIF